MKAIVLISGGLDSILAAKIIKDQGIGIIPLNFRVPFSHVNPHSYNGMGLVEFTKNTLGEELRVADVNKDFIEMLLNPRYGFGTHMNPCIDCKILMLLKSKELMQEFCAKFIVTGEVLGQRPMSQHKQALSRIEADAGLKGLLLRPLSAKNLIPTIPEAEGWVDRDKLFNISGRSRRMQIDLAKRFGISGYPNASGGCLLTDRQFSVRLKDLIRHEELSLRNIELLKIGRHFRIGENTKFIVGRNEKENKYLEERAAAGDYLFLTEENAAGPVCLGVGDFSEEQIMLSGRIACRYYDLREDAVKISCRHVPDKKGLSLSVNPLGEGDLAGLRL
ncbi:MAG: tRNA 4-thiouridine(8) synthase ThiI [Candidatus Omnitrophica bacterium]|jgi:tRNA U34 2-thiouridine synthase MnmA/TrmU|nr:tRNA 4-thiouridine(8) synthase ThiI [Candidatus Omnitrophota bacterium]MDD3987547.1 tRNA 4-thiouridine(8) synthase ThiI [Candidatus Omnitrophota bacterium]MDD4981518.1 tRNA 4-thiouridine(8) synthase ThiI [Candidatus Omnitrophota bacterium]MDD5665448.1 tRNA 4-thiouridine(8) synthase ThiI [Candidatus Omnitrophota bacterium]